MIDKEKQKKLIIEIMNADEKDGVYKNLTPVEWLVDQLPIRIRNMHSDDIIRAKEMERSLNGLMNEDQDLQLAQFSGVVYENEKYCIEATILSQEDGEIIKGEVEVEFTDKRVNPRRVDHWDNPLWMVAIHEGQSEAIKEIEYLDLPGIRFVREFMGKLIQKGWL